VSSLKINVLANCFQAAHGPQDKGFLLYTFSLGDHSSNRPPVTCLGHKSTLLQIFLHQNVCDGVEDEPDVVGLGAAGEVGVHRLLLICK